MTTRGFTLIEVMIAGALLSIITAGAAAAFIAQSRATNTQAQTIDANDESREAIRLISNDVRSAAAGVTANAGGISTCDPGTIPFDGSGTPAIACLPPVFRSNTPLILPSTAFGAATTFAAACGDALHPGYQLSFGNGVTVPPTATAFFCPDDLVVLGVDDTNPLFMVQSSPNTSSVGNVNPIDFGGTTPIGRNPGGASVAGAGYGFDNSSPLNYLPLVGTANACAVTTNPNLFCEPTMLFGGPSGAVLINTAYSGVANPWAGNAKCAIANCDVTYYSLVPTTASSDLFRNNLAFGAVAMPAHLYRYAVEPVDATGAPSDCNKTPCVGANLVRSVIVPFTTKGTAGTSLLNYQTVSSTTLIQGVVDMQVEFGIQSTLPNAALSYVNSGGLQASPWAPPFTPGSQPAASTAIADNCLGGGAIDPGVWTGVCFPTGGGTSGLNAIANLRTVRLNLTIRSGTGINTHMNSSAQGATAISAMGLLQPSIQDLSPAGNKEAAQWGYSSAAVGGFTALQANDGATYRQVSTEIYMRNLGWTNNL